MRSLLIRKLPRGRPRQGRRNDKVLDITKAGTRLLARKDFDAWSMAELAREAGCSVGTLYTRFPDKYACLYYLVDTNLRGLTEAASSALSPALSDGLTLAGKGKLFVSHVVYEMTRPSAAGVIRAVTKLATLRPNVIEKFEKYRNTVSNCAVAMFQDELDQDVSRNTIHIAVQVVLATITDAILQQKPGPMSAGSDRMESALTNIFLGYLGLRKKRKWVQTEADDAEGRIDNEIFDEPLALEETRYDPIEQGFRRRKAPRESKARPLKAIPKDATPPVRTPPKAPNSPASLPRRRSRRKRRAV
jgi:AcrR family transcriptional regulator